MPSPLPPPEPLGLPESPDPDVFPLSLEPDPGVPRPLPLSPKSVRRVCPARLFLGSLCDSAVLALLPLPPNPEADPVLKTG